MSFEKLGPGDYFLIIDAADLVTGERDVYNGSIELISARSGSQPTSSLISFCPELRRRDAFRASSAS
ncbi:MAG: hypothetical protein MZV64_11515 [Ignavibacteriales bacterium]|nr:hypothetical protein [Ignavibacteriales bacterium]MCK7518297.1 hypothetical protein [Ignavibacteriales bacterium]